MAARAAPPEVKTYTFDDVVNTLNQVVALRLARLLDGAAHQPRSRRAADRHREQRLEAGV